jgi:hypothetical protein
MNNNSTFARAGQIVIKESKRGVEFHAFNFQRQRLIHVGTLNGSVYEKGNCVILRQPEPSFCLPQSEYGAAVEAGALYLRCIPPDKSATYAISLQDFKEFSTPFYNQMYGPQWRVPVSKFSHTSKVSKRNVILDSPALAVARDIVQERQMSLFG